MTVPKPVYRPPLVMIVVGLAFWLVLGAIAVFAYNVVAG